MRSLTAAALVALAVLSLHASSAKFFQSATQTDFLKGDVENLSMDSHGQLTLGPATELVFETSAPFLWSMIAESDGSIFIGGEKEFKRFNIRDGLGLKFLQQNGGNLPKEVRATVEGIARSGGTPTNLSNQEFEKRAAFALSHSLVMYQASEERLCIL